MPLTVLDEDRDGELVQHYGYLPFGNERYQDNTQAFSVTNRYTGQHLDEETGLYFYGSRYYDPELARFIQPDTIVPDGDSQSLNRYTYCVNNPIRFVDPTGHFIVAVAAAIVSHIVTHATTIIVSAAINAGIAAAQGGNVWKAAAAGAIAGAFGAVGGIEWACAGGALGALVTGGDPGMAAATAAIAASVSIACDFTPISDWANALPDIKIGSIHLRKLAATSGVGALVGGTTAEIFGGSFGEGAAWGAASAASGYVVSNALNDSLKDLYNKVSSFVAHKFKDWISNTIETKLNSLRQNKSWFSNLLFGDSEGWRGQLHIEEGLTIDIEAKGYAATVLNMDIMDSFATDVIQKGSPYIVSGGNTSSGNYSESVTNIEIGKPGDALPIPFSLDIYTGPIVILGGVRLTPSATHMFKTTITGSITMKAEIKWQLYSK